MTEYTHLRNRLHLYTNKFNVGCYDRDNITLNSNVVVYDSFRGCITDLSASKIAFSTFKSVFDSANVRQCLAAANDFCASGPCLNNGVCTSTAESYRCKCPIQYSGDNCERKKGICETLNPCLNGGTCSGSSYSYSCSCPLGYRGTTCNETVNLSNEISLVGNGYLELSGDVLPHTLAGDDEMVEIEFFTISDDGT